MDLLDWVLVLLAYNLWLGLGMLVMYVLYLHCPSQLRAFIGGSFIGVLVAVLTWPWAGAVILTLALHDRVAGAGRADAPTAS